MMLTAAPQTLLLLLQFFCFTITLLMALLLTFSRIHTRHLVHRYEASRWMLVATMLIYLVHYALQMIFGFRAQGDDVGATINILFYTPAIFLLSYNIVYLLSGRRCMRFYLTTGAIGYALIAATFIAGLTTYHSLHMPIALNVMGGLYTLITAITILCPLREMRQARQKIESETAGDLSGFNLYMKTGTMLLLVTGMFVPGVIFSLSMLAIIGPFFMLTLFFYTVSFVALGFNISSVSDYMENEDNLIDSDDLPASATAPQDPDHHDGDSSIHRATNAVTLEEAIARWRERRGYSVTNLGLNSLAEQLGVSKRELTDYIAQVHGTTFRVWLSNVRIEEVKRMLIEHDNYSNESIAQECGFSSRSWMQEKFKAQTGLTPIEWKEAHKSLIASQFSTNRTPADGATEQAESPQSDETEQ